MQKNDISQFEDVPRQTGIWQPSDWAWDLFVPLKGARDGRDFIGDCLKTEL